MMEPLTGLNGDQELIDRAFDKLLEGHKAQWNYLIKWAQGFVERQKILVDKTYNCPIEKVIFTREPY